MQCLFVHCLHTQLVQTTASGLSLLFYSYITGQMVQFIVFASFKCICRLGCVKFGTRLFIQQTLKLLGTSSLLPTVLIKMMNAIKTSLDSPNSNVCPFLFNILNSRSLLVSLVKYFWKLKSYQHTSEHSQCIKRNMLHKQMCAPHDYTSLCVYV